MTNQNASRFAKHGLAAAAAMAAVSGASAATIAWDGGDTTVTASDIINVGTAVVAVNGGPLAGEVTINGVGFAPGNPLGGAYNFAGGTALASTGDASLDELLSDLTYNPAGGGSELTIDGLTIGNDYVIQALYGDNRGCCNDRFAALGTTAAGGVTTGPVAGNTGVLFTGTFTADATSQTFYVETSNAGGTVVIGAEVNGYQVRDITGVEIPEPSSLALLGLGGLLVARRRRG